MQETQPLIFAEPVLVGCCSMARCAARRFCLADHREFRRYDDRGVDECRLLPSLPDDGSKFINRGSYIKSQAKFVLLYETMNELWKKSK
jgi:hypothetical protein